MSTNMDDTQALALLDTPALTAALHERSTPMFIERSYIRGKSLILHDENGSEESMPLQDALSLLLWLQEHKGEIEAALQEPDEEETFAVD